MTVDGWTIREACDDFTAAGLPADPGRLAVIVRALPGFRRIGERRAPAGSKGGRREALYEIGELQDLITAIARWL